MRIETYNQVAQVYKANQTQKMGKAERVTRRDEVQISSLGTDYQIAKKAMADIPDVRKDKIAAIKAGMEAGTYKVDSSNFADKLCEKYTDILGY